MGLLFYLIVFWVAVAIYHRFLLRGRLQRKRSVKLLWAHLRDRLRWDRDILSDKQAERLEALVQRGAELRRERDPGEEAVETYNNEAQDCVESLADLRPNPQMRELLELLVVVFGVVMGIRALFFQPFKIPTGSMQPTLFGIHYVAMEDPIPPQNAVARLFHLVNFGARAVDEVIQRPGALGEGKNGHALELGPLRFFPEAKVGVAGHTYRVPGNWIVYPPNRGSSPQSGKARDFVQEWYLRQHGNFGLVPYYDEGDILARGELRTGDHLFVDRVWYNIAEPKRGDIVVFNTRGITYENQKLSGFFYIKRLVGMPGETLKIQDRQLYRKTEDGAWNLVDGEEHPAFDAIYSMQGGYRGYWLPGSDRAHVLNKDQPEITLGPDQYLLLGDNSENSLDSRYWGPVPRQNIVGVARVIWWPFSRRWGITDHAPPEARATPPQRQ